MFGAHALWAEPRTMFDEENERPDASPSLLAALAAMEEWLQAGQAEMEKRQQQRQDETSRAVQDVQAQLSGWKEELKQFTRESCHEVMQELEEEVSRLSVTVEERVGHLEECLRAVEQSAVLVGALFAAACLKEERTFDKDDKASSAGGHHSLSADGGVSARGGTPIMPNSRSWRRLRPGTQGSVQCSWCPL